MRIIYLVAVLLSFPLLVFCQRLKIDFEAEQRKPAKNLPSQSVLNLSIQQFKAYDDSAKARIERSKFPRKIGEAYLVDVIDGHPVYWGTTNAGAAKSVGTDILHNRYPNLVSQSPSISALRMGIWDGGAVKATHEEFGDRVTNITREDVNRHATHVAGTMIASGVKAEAKGMLPNGRLSAFSFPKNSSSNSYWPDLGVFSNTFPNGLVSNHSYGTASGWEKSVQENSWPFPDVVTWTWYGDKRVDRSTDYKFGYYSQVSKRLDSISFQYKNHLLVFAAMNNRDDIPEFKSTDKIKYLDPHSGEVIEDKDLRANFDGWPDGYDCLSDQASAKNVLTVGAIRKSDKLISGKEFIKITSFSSFGPTDDGRIKPDIVAPGADIFSVSIERFDKYRIDSGTSMAAPVVSGTAGLLQQVYFSKHYKFLTAASLKGLIIHTATAGEDFEKPNYMVGWGALNADAADQFIQNMEGSNTLLENELSNEQFDTLVCYSDGSPMKATLVWTDPPSDKIFSGREAFNNRTAHLVNDLDLKIFSSVQVGHPKPEPFLPYTLDVENPSSPAKKKDNVVDNVEKVYEAAPAPGIYYVVVKHKPTLLNQENQAYSLLLSGVRNVTAGDFIEAFRDGNDLSVKISWNSFGEGEEPFQIERRNGRFGSFHPVGTVDKGTLEFIDNAALRSDILYHYRVVRTLPDNSIISSKIVSVSSFVPIQAPTNFTLTPSVSDAPERTVTLRWMDASTNEKGFVVERSIDGIHYFPMDSLPAVVGVGAIVERTYDKIPQNSTLWFRIRVYNVGSNVAVSEVRFHSFERLPNFPLQKVEYYFDYDPGFGNGRSLGNLGNITSYTGNTSLVVEDLSEGFHTAYIRALQSNGRWSNIISHSFFKFNTLFNRRLIQRLEYYFNEDPGLDNGLSMEYPAATSAIDHSLTIPLDNLPIGLNTLYVRARDNYGLWSNIFSKPFLKLNGPDGRREVVEVLYTIDNGLLISGGTPISLTADSALDLVLDLPPLNNGPHTLSIRAKDNVGFYSNIYIDSFFVNDESFCQLGSDVYFKATVPSASSYIWHEFNGSTWVPIRDASLFAGFNTRILQLKKPPTNWYGRQFRCVVDGRLDEPFILKFNNTWTGQVSADWHDYRNWSCGVVPDEYVDAVLPPNLSVYPEIVDDGECRSLIIKNGAVIRLKAGKSLLIYGTGE